MIDIGRSVQHPFEDKEWPTKILIGAGVGLVPILSFALNGYTLDVLRNTSRGQDVPLPRWDDLSRQFVDGLKLFVAQLVYAIPLLVIMFGYIILSVGFGASSDRMGRSASDAVSAGFGILSLAFLCIYFVYILALAFITPAIYVQVARTGNIGAAFNVNEILALIKRKTTDYILVAVVPILIGIVFSVFFGVLSLIPIVNLCLFVLLIPLTILVTPYLNIVFGHLYGQLARE